MKHHFYVPLAESVEDYAPMIEMLEIPVQHGGVGDLPQRAGVVAVPEHKTVLVKFPTARVGFHQIVNYLNEFEDLRSELVLNLVVKRKNVLRYESLRPQAAMKHSVRWAFVISNFGKYEGTILHHGKKVETFNFVAYRK
jgi:hypothetical protein